MNHSKRDIERKVDDLDRGGDNEGSPLVLNLAGLMQGAGEERPTRRGSPHPSLTVQTWPEGRPRDLSIATPKIMPEPWGSMPMLFVHTCENAEKYCMDHMDEDSSVVTACQLWEGLDEADLREDVKIRQENDDPIPPFLEGYATE